jgi:hypothetical protein
VLWDSGAFPIINAPAGLRIDINGITDARTIPNASFTWAVEFAGIGAGETAGLTRYSPPTIGNNFTDYWERNAQGQWELRASLDGKNMDFGAQITVVPEPGTIALGALAGVSLLGMAAAKRRKK